MMITLHDYLLSESLYEGIDTVIYRARRKTDLQTVIVKTVRAEYPSLEEIARLQHEYRILRSLSHVSGIVQAQGLINDQNNFALILEDFPGVSLQQVLDVEKIPTGLFLHLALQLVETLHQIHSNHIIHKDINPQNILLDLETWQVKLIDFSIASRLSKESPALSHLETLEGTLAYIAPEQTGRMNRVVDYRSDFYSLGVTFYHMLTGQLPVPSTDALTLIHGHIAQIPVPPHELLPDIPAPLSAIVMKLLAKMAEDRYQTALGLKADLELCQQYLLAIAEIPDFTPGKFDQSGQFLMPQKLYGRMEEVRSLLTAFERVSHGRTELMLISGYTGVGKTSIVCEIHKPIVERQGYFISGKFDPFQQNIPYAALSQAFETFVQQRLAESDEKIQQWRQTLLEALGQNGQVILDVIPDLEHLIGLQSPIPQLGAGESQMRFNRVFQQFIRVFASTEHPLVIFLDDLQWADAASLKLLQSLLADPDSANLLIIAAYRDHEVSPSHPTMMAIAAIEEAGATVHHIVLNPLTPDHVRALICDTFSADPSACDLAQSGEQEARIQPFVELIYNKTQGNPFFLTQLLHMLYAENLLQFDVEVGQWVWKVDQIQAVGITDLTVVELMARQLHRLPIRTQQVLQLAACMGHQFQLDALAMVSEQSLLSTADKLWDALQAGLILPLSQAYKVPLLVPELERRQQEFDDLRVSYRFLHDRVQQAAYSLIPEDQKQKTHLKMGRLLLQKTSPNSLEDHIFDVVNQLNIGRSLITNVSEKEQLASLNLIAGRKAKAANAYEAAARYLNTGLELLTPEHWRSHESLMLSLHTEATEAESLNTRYERAEQLANTVLKYAREPLDKVKVYETKIQFHIAQNQMQEAIATALEALELLGVSLPQQPNQLGIFADSMLTKLAVSTRQIEDLAKLPEMTDPTKIAAMRILIAVLVPAFLSAPNLFPIVTFKMVNLSLRYGNSPQAAYGYALYGWLLCGSLGDISLGYRFGQLAMQLLNQFDARELHCKVINLFNAFIRPWKEHTRNTIPAFEGALQASLATGDLEYAGYSSINFCHYSFLVGEPLETVKTAQTPYVDLMRTLKQDHVLHSIKTVRQTVLNLLGEVNDPCRLVGESFNEEEMLPVFQNAKVMTSLFMVYFYKSMLSCLFRQHRAAVENAQQAEAYLPSIAGFATVAAHNFYYSLALLGQAIANKAVGNLAAQKQALKQVEANQKAMKHWATHAPNNYQHRYALVEAEKARVMGQATSAMQFYDRAIKTARSAGYIQDEALANELATEFYLEQGQQSMGEVYLLQAYYGYIRWGAIAKAKDLEFRYAEFFSKVLQREARDLNRMQLPTLAALDLAAVAKALETIVTETDFDQMISHLMQIILQAAGSSKGMLFLGSPDRLRLVAEGSIHCPVRMVQSGAIASPDVPIACLNYVRRTHKTLVLNHPSSKGSFITDPYMLQHQPKSIFCYPLIHQGQFTGVLYLENDLIAEAFTNPRLELLDLLTAQVSVSLAHASSDHSFI